MATYGIDLGTTYSCISKMGPNGNPEIIRNQEDSSDTLASAVFFENEENVIVGDAAKDMIETDGDRVVQYAKRYIGKADAPTYEFFSKSYTPVEISAIILKRIKQIAEDQGESVNDVVITCPAYFGIEEREATRQAGVLAGMNVLNLINEPTAAALNYCARQFQEDKTILVYDLGGGTFDVTVVRMTMVTREDGQEVPQVIVVDTGGNDQLGGKDWDDKLFDFILNEVCEDNGLMPEEIDSEIRQAIRSKIEKTKQKLSKKDAEKVKIGVNGTMTTVNILREEFESITADKVAQTMAYVDDVLNRNPDLQIDTVLLVGGSTYMPMIRNAVEAKFPGKVQLHDPDRAVAMGALIYADMIGSEPEPVPVSSTAGEGPEDEIAASSEITEKMPVSSVPAMDIMDITPRSFGPGVLDNRDEYVIDNIIKKNTPMPVNVVKTYYTPQDNMEKIQLRAFENQSEEDHVKPCVDAYGEPQETDPALAVKMLGETGLELMLPPGTPKDSGIEVTFQLDAQGLYIRAVNVLTGENIDATIKFQSDVDMEHSAVNVLKVSGE